MSWHAGFDCDRAVAEGSESQTCQCRKLALDRRKHILTLEL